MLFKYCDRVVLTVLLLGLCTRFNAVAESGEKFRIEGRALVYGVRTEEWTPLAHVLLDGEEHVGFVRFYNLFEWGNSYNTMHQLSYRMFLTLLCPTRLDGSFTVNDVPSGSYVVHVASPVYRFEPVRVDITAAGKMRARRVNYIKPSEVVQLPYPIQMRCTGQHSYFAKRDTWVWSDFFMNPVVLMMVLPLLIILLLPKLINMNDPGMRREMEQSMNVLNPSPELPDVSELMTKFFAPPKSQGKSGTHKGHRGSGPRRR